MGFEKKKKTLPKDNNIILWKLKTLISPIESRNTLNVLAFQTIFNFQFIVIRKKVVSDLLKLPKINISHTPPWLNNKYYIYLVNVYIKGTIKMKYEWR